MSAYWVIAEHSRDYYDWVNDLVVNAPDSFDDDVALEEIVTRYVRWLESEQTEDLAQARHMAMELEEQNAELLVTVRRLAAELAATDKMVGRCTVTRDGLFEGDELGCDLLHGHTGRHHDPRYDGHWLPLGYAPTPADEAHSDAGPHRG
ncbi:MAG TPA: hypothetical protein VG899_12355 [Mycobacteriales bacterium]|nr:hypothetical protein [Mycobacteriales bacterium]